MAQVHQFAYGWINPAIAYAMSFLGSLLALVLAAQAHESSGAHRARSLMLASVALGGTGIWLMHFMAILGFDVSGSVLRHDLRIAALSLVMAVAVVGAGLFLVHAGSPALSRVVVAGVLTGSGIAATHYTGVAAIRLNGRVSYDPWLVVLSVAISVVIATAALWYAVSVRTGRTTVGAALLIGLGMSCVHYTWMAAVRVRLDGEVTDVAGVSPFALLVPVCILATVVVAALAYCAVGVTLQQESARADVLVGQLVTSRLPNRAQAAVQNTAVYSAAVSSPRPSDPVATGLRSRSPYAVQ